MNALARFIAYLAAVALGLFMAVYGVVTGDAMLTASGVGLVTTGGLASTHTPVRTGNHGAS